MAAVDPETKKHINELKRMFASETEARKMTDEQMLALLLSYTNCAPELDRVMANIYNYFGSYRQCFMAPYKELCNVEGLTCNAAMLILMVSSIYSMRDRPPVIGKKVTSVEELFLRSAGRRRDEEFYMAAFDADNILLGFEKLAVGTPDTVGFFICDLVDFAAYYNAKRTVVAHTHPGAAVPEASERDIETMNMIGASFVSLGIEFIGQVIIAGGQAKLFSYEPERGWQY